MQNVDFAIQLPDPESVFNLPIEDEYVWVIQDGTKRKVLIHDYGELYRTPYLYDRVMEKLQTRTHTMVPALLVKHFTQMGGTVTDMVVLDIAAGSGLTGKALADLGVESITGLDILPEAAAVAQHQYPGLYKQYYAEDLTCLSDATYEALINQRFNCLICCAALSGGRLPAAAMDTALDLLAPDGWVAFNISKRRWEKKGVGGFFQMHPWAAQADRFEIVATCPYRHRLYLNGRPLDAFALIGRKRG